MLIWALTRDRKLSRQAREAIVDGRNWVAVSAVTAWELAVKVSLGKLRIPDDLLRQLDSKRFARLAITFDHGLAAGALPLHHSDPFDRLLIAQAQIEGLTVVTRDRSFAAYDVAVLPA